MRKNGNGAYWKVILIMVLLAAKCPLVAQGQHIWSDVSLNKSSVYMGEPVQVKIRVYTSTWFTSGIDPGNIKVNGAFTTYFRPVSTSYSQNGTTYAGVELIYNVFPFKEEDITFPALELRVESPAPGDFKGVARSLKTDPKIIKVKPVPPDMDKDEWLVASGLDVHEHWSEPTQSVKVGDVLERSISREVYGTMSALIPPIVWDSLPGVRFYPSRSQLDDQRTKTDISASRTETMRYLFEKEGEVTVPEMIFYWYNPRSQQLYKRTLAAHKINVQPNPNLGMLETIRDSLDVQQSNLEAPVEKEGPFRFLGLSIKQLVAAAILLMLALYALARLIMWGVKQQKKRRWAYRHSEKYYWDRLRKVARKGKSAEMTNALYRWVDELDLAGPNLSFFGQQYGTAAFRREIAQAVRNGQNGIRWSGSFFQQLEESRKNYLRSRRKDIPLPSPNWINP